jgi:hypothetical protein
MVPSPRWPPSACGVGRGEAVPADRLADCVCGASRRWPTPQPPSRPTSATCVVGSSPTSPRVPGTAPVDLGHPCRLRAWAKLVAHGDNSQPCRLVPSREALEVVGVDGEVAVGGLAGRLVGELEGSRGPGGRPDQAECRRHRSVGEHLLAGAEQQRVEPQVQPVGETEPQERLCELEAAGDMYLVVARLECGDALGEVAGQ